LEEKGNFTPHLGDYRHI